jgi:hypothetical protein
VLSGHQGNTEWGLTQCDVTRVQPGLRTMGEININLQRHGHVVRAVIIAIILAALAVLALRWAADPGVTPANSRHVGFYTWDNQARGPDKRSVQLINVADWSLRRDLEITSWRLLGGAGGFELKDIAIVVGGPEGDGGQTDYNWWWELNEDVRLYQPPLTIPADGWADNEYRLVLNLMYGDQDNAFDHLWLDRLEITLGSGKVVVLPIGRYLVAIPDNPNGPDRIWRDIGELEAAFHEQTGAPQPPIMDADEVLHERG